MSLTVKTFNNSLYLVASNLSLTWKQNKLGNVNGVYDMMESPAKNCQLPPCAPPWMENELVRISKKYSFSITEADNWLQEGLWFELRKRESRYWTKWLLTDWPHAAENLAEMQKCSQMQFQRKI